MKRILILATCTLLAILYSGSVAIYSQKRNADPKLESKFQVKQIPGVGDQFKLIDIRNEFGSRNEYRGFVNLIKQLEMKQRELDMATVRIYRATHGYFKNDPNRSFYERANISLGLRVYRETRPEMLQLLDSLNILLKTASSSPSAKTRSDPWINRIQVIYLLATYFHPAGTYFDAARRSINDTKNWSDHAEKELKISRVRHFFNEVKPWLEKNKLERCFKMVKDLEDGLDKRNIWDEYHRMYEHLSGDCLGGCKRFWNKGMYYYQHPKIREWVPKVLYPLPPYSCKRWDDCKGVTHVNEYLLKGLAFSAFERAKIAHTQASFETLIFDLTPPGVVYKTGKLVVEIGKLAVQKRVAARKNNAQDAAIVLAEDATGNYHLYSVPIVGDQATFNLPEGVYSGVVVASDNYAVAFEDLVIKDKKSVKGITEACSDCGSIDFVPYPPNDDYVYDCDDYCPSCGACSQHQWEGKFEGSIDVSQPCDDGGGMFTIDGDFTIDFLLDDIKESDLPGGAVQDPDAYHFMNNPTTKAKVKWNNFTHRTCPKGCVIRFNKTPPSFDFWTAWDWKVQDDEFVGIDLRFQQLKENTPVYCGPQKTNDFNTYSAGIMALPMADPDKYVPRTDDVIQRTWTDNKGPVKMKLKMRLEKKKKIP